MPRAHRCDAISTKLAPAIVEQANDIVVVCQIDPSDPAKSRIAYVNRAFTNRTGYAAADAIGRAPRFLQGPDTCKGTIDEIRSALRERRAIRAEILNYDRAGRPYWVEMSVFPLAHHRSEPTHFIAIERDITDLRRREDDRHAVQSILASVIAASEDGLLVVDSRGRVLLSNPSFSMLFGWTRERLLGRSFLTVIKKEDRAGISAHHAGLVDVQAPARLIARCVRSDGSIVESGLSASLVPQGDGKRHCVISFAPLAAGHVELGGRAGLGTLPEQRLADDGTMPSPAAGRPELPGVKTLAANLKAQSAALV